MTPSYRDGYSAGESASRSRGGSCGAEHAADLRELVDGEREEFISGFNDALDENTENPDDFG